MILAENVRPIMTRPEFEQLIHAYRDNPFLTPKEMKICEYYLSGMKRREMERKLNISTSTLGHYRYLILEKMGYRTQMRNWPSYRPMLERLDERRAQWEEKSYELG